MEGKMKHIQRIACWRWATLGASLCTYFDSFVIAGSCRWTLQSFRIFRI